MKYLCEEEWLTTHHSTSPHFIQLPYLGNTESVSKAEFHLCDLGRAALPFSNLSFLFYKMGVMASSQGAGWACRRYMC